MYLMYVDESGDCGTVNSPTQYFILTALVFHELRWFEILEDLVEFRRDLKRTKNLKIKDEIHSVKFLNSPGGLARISRNDRLDILKKCIDWVNRQPMSTFSIIVDKSRFSSSADIFDAAWQALIQRFENTLSHSNFPGAKFTDDKGIVITDNTDGKKLKRLLRKMRHFNVVPSMIPGSSGRNLKLRFIVEDPIMKDSMDSLVHQMVDVIAYFVKQKHIPSTYVKKKGAHNFYNRLDNVYLIPATRSNKQGLVYR